MGDEEALPLYARDYEPSPMASLWNNLPRMGHSDDVTLLLSDDFEDVREYSIGVALLGILLMIVFVLWLFLLAVWKCCQCCNLRCSHSIGFLSGRPFRRVMPETYLTKQLTKQQRQDQAEIERMRQHAEIAIREQDGISDDEDDMAHDYRRKGTRRVKPPPAWTEAKAGVGGTVLPPTEHASSENNNNKRRWKNNNSRNNSFDDYEPPFEARNLHEPNSCYNPTTRYRCCFLLSGILFLLGTVLGIALGLTNAVDTLDTVDVNAKAIRQISVEALTLVNEDLVNIQALAPVIRDLALYELQPSVFCPGSTLVQDSEQVQQFLELAQDAVDVLNELENFAQDETDQVRDAATDLEKLAVDIMEFVNNIDLYGIQAAVCAALITILPVLLMAGALMAMMDVTSTKYNCVLGVTVLPFFYLIVVAAAAITVLTTIVLGFHADLCDPDSQVASTPDDVIINVLTEEGYGPNDSFAGEVMNYYVRQCPSNLTDPFAELREYVPLIQDAGETAGAVLALLQNPESVAQLRIFCNREFDTLKLLMTQVQEALVVVNTAIQRIENLVACERLVPIYTNIVYDGACESSLSAWFWIFFGALFAAFAGLVMLTLRSSYKPTTYLVPRSYTEDDDDHDLALRSHELSPTVTGAEPPVAVADYGLENSPVNTMSSSPAAGTASPVPPSVSSSKPTEKHGNKAKKGFFRGSRNKNDSDTRPPTIVEPVGWGE